MKIINPIYDQAFKYLMENKKIAKKILSVILEEEIISIRLATREISVNDPFRLVRILRMDFKAQIRTKKGERKTVLIELQKCQKPTDIIRFRNYLGKSYMESIDKEKKTKKQYPIITVYILGYPIKGINTAALTINHKITDAVTKQTLHIKNEFIEMLNHKSHIIQIGRLRKERRTRLEKLLTLFDQKWITRNKYVLDVEVDKEFMEVASYMNKITEDEDFRDKLELQEMVNIEFKDVEEKLLTVQEKLIKKEKTIEAKDKTIEEKEKTIEEKEKTIEEKEKTIEEKEKTIEEKEKTIEEKNKLIEELSTKLNKHQH